MQEFERRLPEDAAQMNHQRRFFSQCKTSWQARNISSDFHLTLAANKTLEFSMQNFART
jgi:hypothetical protein